MYMPKGPTTFFQEATLMTNLDHILSLINHGAQLRNTDTGSLIPLTVIFVYLVFFRRKIDMS